MSSAQNQAYRDAAAQFGPALQRLARAAEADADRRRDLLQDMHAALWRSLAGFDGRCALSTWVFRVAHNVAADYVEREKRGRAPLASLDEIADLPAPDAQDDPGALARLMALIRRLKMPDRQILMLYLEDLDAAAIAAIVGLSPGAVAARISRAKIQLAKLHQEGRNV
jgi:RNA polymerase sigma-70 factor (ECF subfamily)